MRLDISEADAKDLFVDYLRSEGLDVSFDKLVTDGSRKWVTCLERTGKNRNSKSAWYRLNFNYDVPSVLYSNYDKGIVKKVWHLDPKQLKKKQLSPQEQRQEEKRRKLNTIKKRRRDRHLNTRQRIAATWSRIEFARAIPIKSINEIPYLKAKLITDDNLNLFNCRKIVHQPLFAKSFHMLVARTIQKAKAKGKIIDYEKPKYFTHGWFQNYHLRNTLITPYYNKDLKIVNVQTISSFPDRDNKGAYKFFKANLSSGQKEATFCPINRLPSLDDQHFAISEGYSTGKSFSRISKDKPCILSAFDKNNLLSVAVAIKERFPHASIYQVADNDLKEQLSKGQNGGVTKALEAANAVNGNVLIPPVKKDEANEISDWNDLEIKYGTQHCFDILNNLLHEISAYKKIEMTKPTPDKPNLLAHQIHSRVPEISLKKTTNALDPSVFTTWLINKLDEKKHQLASSNTTDNSFEIAGDLVRAMASEQGKSIIPMMQYICTKNDWHDLNKAISNLNDKLDFKANTERDTLNKVNLTLQTMFYAVSAVDQDLMSNQAETKNKAELQLQNTIEYISFLQLERKEKLELYNNLKFAIDDAVAIKEPEWAKKLIKICVNSVDAFEKKQNIKLIEKENKEEFSNSL